MHEQRRLGWRRAGAAAALFVGLSVALTWPLARELGRSTPSEYRDARITAWVMAWDAHVLRTDPTDLFQAPMFFPEHDTLAYSDHMLGLGLLGAPITWISGNLFVGHNVVFIASIAFAACAATLLAFELTGSFGAALVAGSAFGFAPFWSNHEMHLHILAAGWIPLALYGLVRWWRSGSISSLAIATVSAVMAALTSWYQAAFVIVALVVVATTFVTANRPRRLIRMAVHAVLAAAVAGAVLLPFAAPYRRVQDRSPRYIRTLDEVAANSARPASYLAAPPSNLIYGRVTERWSAYPQNVELNLFPGIAVVVLAGIGVAGRKRETGERASVVAFVLVAAAGVLLAFGGAPSGPRRFLPWAFLSEHVVLFRGLRAAARAHVLTVLGLSMLAGFGARALLAGKSRRVAGMIGVIGFALVVAEGAATPLDLGAAPPAPVLYARLASRPGGILELPAGRRYDADALLRGTAHWRPLANGVSGYTPQSYFDLLHALERPPDAALLRLLRSRGIATVVLDLDRLGADAAAWDGDFRIQDGVRELHRGASVVIYDLNASRGG